MTVSRMTVLRVLLAASVAAFSPMTPAQSFPEKPIRFVVPFLAGGGADVMARSITARAVEALGQQIIVDNRSGAGGNLGALHVASAAPDGYTLLQGTNGTHAANHFLYKSTGYDPVKDFAPVTRMSEIGLVLVVANESPIKSVDDLLRDLRANPGKRTFGSGGVGSAPHMAGEMFKAATGTDIVHVPYKGNAGAIVDLLAGRLDMMFDVMANALPHVKAGKLRGLAVLSREPHPSAAELPTLHSLGIKDFHVTAWDGVFAPAGTPRAVIDRLNAAFRTALTDPKVRESLVARGAVPVPSTPEELARHVQREIPKWADAVKRAGVQAE